MKETQSLMKSIKSGQDQRNLTEAQAKVFEEIVDLGIAKVILSHFCYGVLTGAGKTEIYMQAIQALFDRSLQLKL